MAAGPGAGPELCPHCRRPFKRLRAHLPHCRAAPAASPRPGPGSKPGSSPQPSAATGSKPAPSPQPSAATGPAPSPAPGSKPGSSPQLSAATGSGPVPSPAPGPRPAAGPGTRSGSRAVRDVARSLDLRPEEVRDVPRKLQKGVKVVIEKHRARVLREKEPRSRGEGTEPGPAPLPQRRETSPKSTSNERRSRAALGSGTGSSKGKESSLKAAKTLQEPAESRNSPGDLVQQEGREKLGTGGEQPAGAAGRRAASARARPERGHSPAAGSAPHAPNTAALLRARLWQQRQGRPRGLGVVPRLVSRLGRAEDFSREAFPRRCEDQSGDTQGWLGTGAARSPLGEAPDGGEAGRAALLDQHPQLLSPGAAGSSAESLEQLLCQIHPREAGGTCWNLHAPGWVLPAQLWLELSAPQAAPLAKIPLKELEQHPGNSHSSWGGSRAPRSRIPAGIPSSRGLAGAGAEEEPLCRLACVAER